MKTILLRAVPNPNYSHFVHYMQYLYWCSDIIINDTNFKYIILEPKNKSNTMYVKSYLKKFLDVFPNVILKKLYDKNNIYLSLIHI